MMPMSELLQLLRGNRKFWFKRAVTALVPGSGFLLFSSPYFLVKLFAGLVFLFSAPMSASWFLVGSFVEPMVFSLRFRKSSRVEDEDFALVLKLAGVKLRNRTLKLVKGLDNAFANSLTRTLSFGEKMFDRMTREERQVVMGHEVGHLVSGILTWRTLASIAGSSLLMLAVTSVVYNAEAVWIIGMSVIYLVSVPMRWSAEYAADEYACKLFGPRAVINTLQKLVPEDKMGIDGDSHPSVNRRIARIKKKWRVEP